MSEKENKKEENLPIKKQEGELYGYGPFSDYDWPFFRHGLFRDMDRLIRDFFEPSLLPEEHFNRYKSPVIRYERSEKGMNYMIEIPGAKKENIQLKMHEVPGLLEILVNEEQEEKKKESYRKISRNYRTVFPLSNELNYAEITAKYENGILSVNLPWQKSKENTESSKEIKIE